MKTTQIIALVAGASLLTFVLSVVFSINMASISPKNLAKIIKKEPGTFIDAVKEASQEFQKQSVEKDMKERLKNRAEIPTKGRVTFGEVSAPISIVEYSDFQCGYCAKAVSRMKDLRKRYEGKVNVVYKHFPLSFHPFAKPAAEYFEAVALIDHEQARKFHDEIFDNFYDYAKLQDEKEIKKKLRDIVKKLNLEGKAVESNLEKAKEVVRQDLAEAEKLQVGGTPSFFINGVDAKGLSLEGVIEALLKELK